MKYEALKGGSLEDLTNDINKLANKGWVLMGPVQMSSIPYGSNSYSSIDKYIATMYLDNKTDMPAEIDLN